MRTKRRLSVKLALYLMGIMVPALVLVSLVLIRKDIDLVEEMTLREAKIAALTAAKSYGELLERAVDEKSITLNEILQPQYEKMSFNDPEGKPIIVEDPRYHTKLSDIATKYGIGNIQTEVVNRGGFLFASGMKLGGYVPVPNPKQNNPPRGIGTEADKLWDRKNSRQYRMYDDAEPRSAAEFRGNPVKGVYTLVQTYFRDTGQDAWDVVAPIYVKGEHFGAFRIGVSKDNLHQQYKEIVVGLAIMFGALVVLAAGFTFFLAWYHIRPLAKLASLVNEMSQTSDMFVLRTRILPPDNTEIGAVALSIDRLRKSLAASIERLEAEPSTSHVGNMNGVHTAITNSYEVQISGDAD